MPRGFPASRCKPSTALPWSAATWTEAERQSKRLPPHPVKRLVSATPDGKPRIEEARYLAEVEEWEYRVLKLRYDAAKTRLRRMREKTGANPRKAGRRNG